MALHPANVFVGEAIELRVHVRIAAAHCLYAPGAAFVPVTLDLRLPPGIEAADNWHTSEPVKDSRGTLIYRDSILFRRTLLIRSNMPPQTMSIEGELRYQVCSDELCWPPESLIIAAPINIRAQAR